MKRTAFVIALLVSTCGSSRSIAENTPTWSPTQPVRIVVPFQAGGPMDTIARIVAQRLNEKWGQSFVVENRTGAGGNIGMELVAKAPADGYTLGTASSGTHGANATLYGSRLPFDPVKDFTPITMLAEMKNILVVHPSLSISNLQELIAYAKAAPGQLTFGSSGTGTIQHLTGEMFKADGPSTAQPVAVFNFERESSRNLALQTIRAELRRSDRLTLVLCYETDNVTALLASKGEQLGRRPGAGLPADKLHRASAHFAARRDERKIRRRLHSWANWSLALAALSAASKDSFDPH
jgi:hypothetical protein